MKEQKIWLSEWCSYNCEFCFNGRKPFKELPIPEIKSSNVEILDPAFLSKHNVTDVINQLGSIKYNRKVIYYELRQGINYKDLTPEIARALKESRFVNIRFAWDRRYNKKIMYKIVDCKNMLIKAGYKSRDLMCFILSNWKIPYSECKRKLDLLKVWNIPVCNCVWRERIGDHVIARYWDIETIRKFRTYDCRKHNQIIKFQIDPELK